MQQNSQAHDTSPTLPAGVIILIRWLLESTTMMLPMVSTDTPLGLQNKAAEPVPSTYPVAIPPALPPPATVETTPTQQQQKQQQQHT